MMASRNYGPRESVWMAILAICVLIAWLTGCALPLQYRLAVASEQLAVSTEHVQLAVIELHDEGVLSDGDYRAWQVQMAQLAKIGLAFNAALRAGTGAAATEQLRAAVNMVDDLLKQDVPRIPRQHRVRVMLALESVRAVLVSLSVAVEA